LAKLKIGSIVFIVSLFLALVSVIVTSVVSSLVFVRSMREEMDDTVVTATDGMAQNIESTVERMRLFVLEFTDSRELALLIENHDKAALDKMMLPFLRVAGFDTLTITDEKGIVLSRPHMPGRTEDDVSSKGYVGPALEGRMVTTIELGTTIGLGAFYGAPVMSGGRIVGSIAVGVNLGTPFMLDWLGEMYRAEMSLFHGDTRVSTTFDENERQMLGTKADPAIVEAVVGRGESRYRELRFSDGRVFRALYKPFVFNGETVGMLSAVIPTQLLENSIKHAVRRVIGAAAVFFLLAMGTSYIFARRISKLSAEKTQQELFLNLLMKNSPDTILIFDNEGRFIHCTDDFLRKINVESFSDIRSRMFTDVLANFLDDSEISRFSGIFVNSMLERKNMSFDIKIDFSGEDSASSYTVRFTPMLDARGEMIGGMALFHDLTDLIRAQRADAASQAKSAFLANISHEIRTPLNAVIGLSEIELRNDLPCDTRENIEKIYSSGATLLGIINDVLDISKIESGKFEIIPIQYDFPNLISDAIHLNVVRIASKPIKFEPHIDEDIPIKLFGDEIRIKQILNNILSNAFKYTLEGTVTLSVSCERVDEYALIRYEVRDTGVGIRKEEQGQLFSEYVQFNTKANRKIEGTGLGLSICQKLVDMMGGTIEVESEYGKGSIFTVRIWQGIADPTPIGSETARSLKTFRLIENRYAKNLLRTPMPYARVLIVDDVITNLDVAKGLMLPYEMTIHGASSGRQAIDIVREGKMRYDAIFMDHMMPEMDGIEALRSIREGIGTEYARTVPIIALTANALVGNEKMFLEKGFQAYLSKPIDIIKLDAILNKFVCREQERPLPTDETRVAVSSGRVSMSESGRWISGLDVEAGISRFGDYDVYLKVVRSYVAHTPSLMEKLRELDRENLSEYAVTVHGIKGSSFGICATRVGEMAEELEFFAKRGELETAVAKNAEFIRALEKLLFDLGAMLGEFDGTRSLPTEKMSAPDAALMDKLLERCTHYDVIGMDSILAELEKYEYESGGEIVGWLRSKLNELEYDDIIDRLKAH
jgi:signal transduction histidine kinase/DNA-binding response OmpR family regulator